MWWTLTWVPMAVVFWSFNAGMYVQEYRHGSITLYHNIDEGTELNHGQP